MGDGIAETRHFTFYLVDGFTHIAFSCAVEPLRIANYVSGQELYRWSFLSEDGVSARASNDTVTLVHHGPLEVPKCDRLFVISGLGMQEQVTPALLNCLRRERARGVAIGALCSGGYMLARAGFELGKRTGHGYVAEGEATYFMTVIDRGADRMVEEGLLFEATAEALKAEARARRDANKFFGYMSYVSQIARKPAP